MPSADVELLAWLVREHLLMSVTAQKQDVSDPEVIDRFASRVADREHLDYLYLLTCATSPAPARSCGTAGRTACSPTCTPPRATRCAAAWSIRSTPRTSWPTPATWPWPR
jgi:hypothetical protein